MPFCSICGRFTEEIGKTAQGLCTTCSAYVELSESPIQGKPTGAKPSNITKNIAIVVILIIVGSIFASAFSGSKPEAGTQTIIAPFKTEVPTTTVPLPNITRTFPSPSAARSPMQMPSGTNLQNWSYYAMEWFDRTYGKPNVQTTRNSMFKMVAFYYFVNEYLTYKPDPPEGYVQTTFETLQLRTGDCEDYAILMASLCEYAGLDVSLDLAYASRESGYERVSQQKNHAMCMVYFDMTPEELRSAMTNLQGIYRISSLGFWHVDEPSRIIVKEDGGFTYISNKYNRGMWVSLENWDRLQIYHRIDYDTHLLTNFEGLRAVICRPFPLVQFSTSPTTSSTQSGYLVTCQVRVTNLGALKAKNVVVSVEADAGSNMVYAQDKSYQFDLTADESRTVPLNLNIPSGVRTRILLRIGGSNFETLKSDGQWFETGAKIGFVWKSASQRGILTITVTVTNYGEVPARNVVVWAAFDAGSGLVYNQQQSPQFDLASQGTRLVTLQVKIPKNVHTRVLVRVYGGNFSMIETQSDWFDT